MDCIKHYIVAAIATALMMHGASALACGDDDDGALAPPEQVAQATTGTESVADPELAEIFGKQTALAVSDESESAAYPANRHCRRIVPEQ